MTAFGGDGSEPRKLVMPLQGKVALITGGTSGIGQATAALFVQEGARVAITGRRSVRGERIANQIGVKYIQADHRQLADCEQSITATLTEYGRIDILFNNAGIVMGGTAEAVSEEDWSETL